MQRHLLITMLEVSQREDGISGLFLQDGVYQGKTIRIMLRLLIQLSIMDN